MITAWHFMADRDGKPILRDGRPAPEVGEWLVHDGPILMGDSGLHASLDPLNALKYAPGPWVARVECDDVEAREDDKFVCRRRRILWMADATPVLHWFARRYALDSIHEWDMACIAAMDNVNYAARYAARAAARAALRYAAEEARTAMSDAAWYPAIDAARAKQSRRLRRGLMTLTGGKR